MFWQQKAFVRMHFLSNNEKSEPVSWAPVFYAGLYLQIVLCIPGGFMLTIEVKIACSRPIRESC